MARREAIDPNRNELTLQDNLSDSKIVLYYRLPETSERQKYHNATLSRRGKKVELNHAKARLDAGMGILTGFKVGSFERVVDGKHVAFSSVEGEENYYPEWRKWVEKNADDLVMLLAARVFDAPSSISSDQEGEEEEEDIEGK